MNQISFKKIIREFFKSCLFGERIDSLDQFQLRIKKFISEELVGITIKDLDYVFFTKDIRIFQETQAFQEAMEKLYNIIRDLFQSNLIKNKADSSLLKPDEQNIMRINFIITEFKSGEISPGIPLSSIRDAYSWHIAANKRKEELIEKYGSLANIK